MAGKSTDVPAALGLLVLRLGACGLLIVQHGWPKLAHFAERSHRFSDPLHIGRPLSLALAVFAEVVCAAFVLVGFATRIAVIPMLILFGVIVFIVTAGQPLDEREMGMLYGVLVLAIALLGPGRYSIDGASGRA
jgi:putative oxidoreductase